MRRLFYCPLLLVCFLCGCPRSEATEEDDSTYSFTSIMGLLGDLANIHELKEVMTKAANGVVNKKACEVCNVVVGILTNYIKKGKSVDRLVSLLKNGCAFFRLAQHEVCNGFVDMYKNEIIYIAKNLISPVEEVCPVLMGPTCGKLRSKVHNWAIHLDERNKPPLRAFPVVTNGQTVRVLQLADTHYDPEYTPGSNGDCRDPLCCRSGAPATKKAEAGKWGYPGKCDIPFRTMQSMMQHAANTHKIDMILWTGDLPPHDMWKSRKGESIDNIRNTSALIRIYFPGVPVYPALGNHEAVPTNSFPVKNPSNLTIQWLYDEIATEWGRFLPSSTAGTIKRGGFYAVKAADRLKVISLNTNFCYIYNWWLAFNSTDPEGQLQWLVSQLQEAEDAGDKVLIIGHVPPGYSECTKVWSRQFHRIVNRYESTITAQVYGHMHTDEFQVYHDIQERSRPISVAYVGPSITTYLRQNPGYRLYLLDGNHGNATWTVTDHETYVMNVTDANITDKPKWELEYRAKAAYGLRSLAPTDWSNLISRFHKNNRMFRKYYKYLNKLYPADVCNKDCKTTTICNMKAYANQVLTDCTMQKDN